MGEKDTKPIEVFNTTACDKIEIIKETIIKEAAPEPIFTTRNPFALSTVVYESSQKKAEDLLPLFIAIVMTIIAVSLVFFKI